jgi:PAS domain S-box-containing protein
MRKNLLNPRLAFFNPDMQDRFIIFSKTFGVISTAIGFVVIAGWVSGITFLTHIIPGFPSMRVLSSLGLAIVGIALLCSLSSKKIWRLYAKNILAFLITLFGMISLFEYFMNSQTFITSLLQKLLSETIGGILPPTVSLLFVCAGLALLFLDRGKKALYQYFLLIGFIIVLPSIIEHFYGIDFIYGFASHTKIALHVTVVMCLLYLGILFARPGKGIMSVISSETAGGYIARRMLLTGVFLPLLIGGIAYTGNQIGWYDSEFRFLLFVALVIMVFSYVIWRNARSVHSLDIVRRESEQSVYRLAAIVESSDDAIIGRDMRGIVTDWNRGAEELFGYTADEIIGKSISVLFPESNSSELQKFNKLMRAGKAVKEYEATRITKDGLVIPLSITASPIKNDEGRVIGLSAICRDITERKQVERQRELFISIASHELKTPVTSTKAYAQLLKRHFQKKHDKESIGFLTKMEEQLNKLTELISYLLDVSTIQKGKLQLRLSQLDLNALLNETVEELQRTTLTHRIIKEGKITTKIMGDKNRLTQVFRNILTNAIKYSPNAKELLVTCETLPKSVRISVTDYGIGIAKKEQRKVFDPLYRSHDAKKDNFSGLGLGLYITQEIIRRHGGKISLSSKVGKGTTVHILLPRRKIPSKTK